MDIPIYYDPMLAKLIAYGKDRTEAIARMIRAIHDYKIVGVKNTLAFCEFVLKHEDFVSGKFDTNFVAKHFKPEYLKQSNEDEMEIAALLAGYLSDKPSAKKASSAKPKQAEEGRSIWAKKRGTYRD